MENLIVIIVSIILLILDNSVVPFFSIRGAYPSLLFTFAIAYSLIRGKEKSVFVAVISGILQDIFFGSVFGVNSLLNLFLCLFASVIGEGIFRNKRLIPVVSAFGLTMLKYIGVFVIFYIARIEIDFSKAIIMSLYNSVVMFFGYRLVMRISNEEYEKRTWRFKW